MGKTRWTAEYVENYLRKTMAEWTQSQSLSVSEIGDGNINYVYRVCDTISGKSLVLKRSDELLRSSGRPLDTGRSRIEAEVLRLQGQWAPGLVPKVFHYDELNHIIIMEDLSDHENLRYALMEGKIFPHLPSRIGRFVAAVTLPTTDLASDRRKKKRQVARLINPDLCDITEDLVLSEPYTDYKGRNVITKGNEDFVREWIYQDERLKTEVGKLRHRFMNHAQALLHGDLHTGSIFVTEESFKVIDPEFAFYGPIGYDLGNVVANLCFAWAHSYYGERSGREDFLRWIREAVAESVESFKTQWQSEYERSVKDEMAKGASFQQWYLEEILADAAGYAGTELIRRIIGDSKVKDITSLKQPEQRIEAERHLITVAKDWILRRSEMKCGKDYTAW